jgi:tripartite-type tricarboxylate transporter receptor subunit TctC
MPIALAACAAWLMFAGYAAAGDSYPSRPIKIIVPYSAGGIVDVWTRRIGDRLSKAMGQPTVIENRPGGSGTIGLATAAQAAPDGYTLAIGSTSNLAVSPALNSALGYDPVKSFQPVTLINTVSMVLLVNPSLGVRSLQDFVALAKSKPGAFAYASAGATTTQHAAGEVLKRTLDLDLLHVPYKGGTPALLSILSGETQAGFDFPDTCAQHVKAGKVHALMVTGARRVPMLPGVPSATELGVPQLDLMPGGGIVVPAGTPKEIVTRLNAELVKILRSPEMMAEIERSGSTVGATTPDEFRAWIETERAKWAKIIRETGIKPE